MDASERDGVRSQFHYGRCALGGDRCGNARGWDVPAARRANEGRAIARDRTGLSARVWSPRGIRDRSLGAVFADGARARLRNHRFRCEHARGNSNVGVRESLVPDRACCDRCSLRLGGWGDRRTHGISRLN
jgi:hypothetical protein